MRSGGLEKNRKFNKFFKKTRTPANKQLEDQYNQHLQFTPINIWFLVAFSQQCFLYSWLPINLLQNPSSMRHHISFGKLTLSFPLAPLYSRSLWLKFLPLLLCMEPTAPPEYSNNALGSPGQTHQEFILKRKRWEKCFKRTIRCDSISQQYHP